ncbi:MAG: DUF4340 domain-containing protein [Bacteroidales bacterium]|nr:DUF4340 domain-containing protein [Bacteroidales bacterium]
MSKRFDNKKLVMVLAGLLAILLLTIMVKIPKNRSTLKEKLVEFDTAAVTRIVIIPKATDGKDFEFIKENNEWKLKQEDIITIPRGNAVKNILSEVLEIKPKSLAAVNRSEWRDYELTDSLATRIKFLDKKGKNLADIMIGKFSYNQVAASPYSLRQNNIAGISYVRQASEEKIYAVDGFLSLSLGGGFDNWRDRTLLRCSKEEITKITFTLPADSSFVLEKRDSVWYANNLPADSLNTEQYLNSISYLNGEDFRDGYTPGSSPDYQVLIEGNNLLSISIKCFRGVDGKELIFNSSQNPSVFFSTENRELFDKLLKPKEYFTGSDTKKK